EVPLARLGVRHPHRPVLVRPHPHLREEIPGVRRTRHGTGEGSLRGRELPGHGRGRVCDPGSIADLRPAKERTRMTSTDSSRIEVRPTGGSLGADIGGVDVARMDDALFAEVRRAWLD